MRQTKASPHRRRKSAVRIGIVGYVLMIVGLFAVAGWAAAFVTDMMQGTAQRERYEKFIGPVVMMDPIPFENAAEADGHFIHNAALWAALSGENRANYTYDEMGLMLLPATDVDVAATKLFGPDITVEHHSFEDMDGTYLYDPEITAYRIPQVAKLAYSPLVTDIEKEGDTRVLTVGYVAPGNMWSTEVKNDSGEPEPEKYMYYVLAKNGDDWYVKAVRDIDPTAPPVS